MPTFIEQFADAEIKVRYKEPLLTGGLDQMLTGITPQGIHRGFRLATNVANLTVTVQADPADNDHIAAYTTDDGYTLRLRRTGGDFNLDLSPFVSTTVVVAIFAEYANGVTTFAEIRAYELDPTDEFTGAAERGELVVLGTVAVPASGVIPEADIDPTYRTLAWDHIGSDAMEWEQVVENGSFELAADDTTFVGSDRGFVPHWDLQYLPPQHAWEIDSSNPYVGNYALKMEGTGVTPVFGSVIPTERIIAVQPGQLIRVSFWVRGENWPVIGPAGTMGVQLNFYGHQLSLLAFRVVQDKSLNGTFGWTRVDEYIEVPFTPTGIEWCVPSIVVLDSPTPAVAGQTLAFDDIRIWTSKGPPTIPYSSIQDGLTNGAPIVGSLGIAETNVFFFGLTQNLDSFTKGILQIYKFDQVSGVNRYRWRRLDGEPVTHIMEGGSFLLRGLDADSDEGVYPRMHIVVPDHLTSLRANIETIESAISTPTPRPQIRKYAGIWGSGSSNFLNWVINAAYDETINPPFGGFDIDDTTENVSLLYYDNNGDLGILGYDPAGGTPFSIFEELFYIDSDVTDPSVEVRIKDGAIRFTGASASTNTNRGDPGNDNVLCAVNIVKAWVYFRIGDGTAQIIETFGFSGITWDDFVPTLTMHRTMDSSTYAVVMQHYGVSSITFRPLTLGLFSFTFGGLTHNTGGGHSQTSFDVGEPDRYGCAIVLGRQS